MMFHPQLGVLNYLLSLVGIGPSEWVFNPDTVIPTLVMVEVWHWTPLVMLIVLGGLAGLPKEPYESAVIDGANGWHMFRYITLPLLVALHHDRADHPHHRRAEGVRHHLRDLAKAARARPPRRSTSSSICRRSSSTRSATPPPWW